MSITASELIIFVIKKYGSCKSYKDAGTSISGNTLIHFWTYFLSPDNFLFEWTSESMDSGRKHRRVIRSNNRRTEWRFEDEAWQQHESIDWALTIHGGTSNGVTSAVGELLMPACFENSQIYKGSRLLHVMPFSYSASTAGPTVIVTSSEAPPFSTEKLRINTGELKICEWESLNQVDILDDIAKLLPQLPDRDIANQVQVAMERRLYTGGPVVLDTKTKYDSVVFDNLTESELRRIDF